MKTSCSFPDCDRPHKAHGLCDSHYAQQKRGYPLTALKTRDSVKAWLLAHADHSGDECLPWPFCRSRGYARMKGGWAYRAMCELVNGPPPTSKHEAAHSCGKGHEGCVNPRHLRWATSVENKADMLIHGTRRRGETIPWARLKTDQVLSIRRMALAMPQKSIAAHYGLSTQTVSEVVNRKTWRHI